MSHYRLNLFIQPEHAKRLDELAAKKGVSKSSIVAAALASWLSPDAGDQREAAISKRLDRLSRQAERLARVYATARHVWNSDEDALAFLHAPHAMLGGQPPLEVAMTELGARRVETLLWRLFYGIAA